MMLKDDWYKQLENEMLKVRRENENFWNEIHSLKCDIEKKHKS